MTKKLQIIFLTLAILVGLVVFYLSRNEPDESPERKEDNIENKNLAENTPVAPVPSPSPVPPQGNPAPPPATLQPLSFSGLVLAGRQSKLYDFTQADYEQAVKTNKLIVLYFYANWCPICRAEVPKLYEAFDELATDRVIGFRVNYNDDETDRNEERLAQNSGVLYQHTKIFLKGSEVVLRAPDTWDKARYLLEIDKYVEK